MNSQFLQPKHRQVVMPPLSKCLPSCQFAKYVVKLRHFLLKIKIIESLIIKYLPYIFEKLRIINTLMAILNSLERLNGQLHPQRLNGLGYVRERCSDCHLSDLLEEGVEDFPGNLITNCLELVLYCHTFLDFHEDVIQEVLEDTQDLLRGVEIVLGVLDTFKCSR